MAKISGLVIFVFGVLITFFSKYLQEGKDPFFEIFFYVGIVFIAWGIIRIIFMPSKRQNKIVKAQEDKKKKWRKFCCPRCESENTMYAKYCQMCGYRLR